MDKIRVYIQYIIILGITLFLLWLALNRLVSAEGDLDVWQLLMQTWAESDKTFMLLMALVAMLSHAIRAARWNLLLTAASHPTSFWKAFHSLMIGYLVNMAIPRGGELSRCYNLSKLQSTPIEVSLGSVVAERTIDLLCMFFIILLTFALEFATIFSLFSGLFETYSITTVSLGKYSLIAVGVTAVAFLLIRLLMRSGKVKAFFQRFWFGFRAGLLSVFAVKNKATFLLQTLIIWLLYLLMSKFVLMAFPETSGLSWGGVMVIFTVGLIAMAIPLPGGAGSYHVLLPLTLIGLYAIPESRAIAFTFIFHAWQSFILILAGAISLVASFVLIKWQAQKK
ncbi:MAG TPA: lysylphosphatidylglycerol synthase transmembrane domain-containing protein [Cyclobacteriaceae bacterium]|nr:lysylphosphatidylglycerol synthase transmembrane domain-containing protein [Cyclobacteriaceae bacterium]